MRDGQKTKVELLQEVDSLRRRVAELEQIELKNTGKEIEDSNQLFQTIFDNAADGMALANVDNKKFYLANKVFCQLLGYNLQEIKNLSVLDIHPEKDLPYVLEQFELQTKQKLKLAKNIPLRKKDGSVVYADVNSFPINLAGKSYIMGIFRDITERRKAETSLKKAEDRLKNYIDSIPMGISIISPNMEILDMNHTFRKRYPKIDVSNKPICYKSFYDPPKEEICTYCPTVKAFKDLKSHYSETDLSADGNYYMVSSAPLKDGKGKVTAVIETVQNITELKKMEESVKVSQSQALSLIQTDPNIILYLSPEHRILEFNPAAEKFFGRKRCDVLGQNYLELFVPEQHRERLASDIEKVLA
ncbi:MAG: PAS domain S-box protein, partial [Sedimentisphaerales bacterium]|nr:PAS domain S-box protein [Sedimentisphaerales bacterium]